MPRWRKLGLVFSPIEYQREGWLNEFAQAPATLVFDDFVRVYFSCRPKPDINGQYISYSAFVDLDKQNLKQVINVADQPILELGDVGSFDEFGTYPVSVIRTNDKIRAYYAGWTRSESVPFNVAIGIAESTDDGKTFTKIGPGPILSYSLNEPFVLSGPKIRKFNDIYFLYYIAGTKWKLVDGMPEPVYKIRLATSRDGLVWEKLDKDLIESVLESDEAQASPDVFFHEGIYHMYFCYRYSANFRNKSRGYRIGYATSEDGLSWKREDQIGGISVSETGWDSEMVSYPHVFELNNEIYMFYGGNQVGRYGFGLAKLVGDRS